MDLRFLACPVLSRVGDQDLFTIIIMGLAYRSSSPWYGRGCVP